jgi:hypothetical protein
MNGYIYMARNQGNSKNITLVLKIFIYHCFEINIDCGISTLASYPMAPNSCLYLNLEGIKCSRTCDCNVTLGLSCQSGVCT